MAHDPGGGPNNWTWVVSDRYVYGLQGSNLPDTQNCYLVWSNTPGSGTFQSDFPWAKPEYPSLWIMGIGFSLTTSATAGARRPAIRVFDNDGSGSNVAKWLSGATTPASSTTWYEFSIHQSYENAGTSGIGATPNTVARDGLPGGLILPGNQSAGVRVEISVLTVQAGDTITNRVVRGMLLYP